MFVSCNAITVYKHNQHQFRRLTELAYFPLNNRIVVTSKSNLWCWWNNSLAWETVIKLESLVRVKNYFAAQLMIASFIENNRNLIQNNQCICITKSSLSIFFRIYLNAMKSQNSHISSKYMIWSSSLNLKLVKIWT